MDSARFYYWIIVPRVPSPPPPEIIETEDGLFDIQTEDGLFDIETE